ncbi:MAG: DNA mismatch repair protein MutS [Dehalococcoidia bacterium]|nr:DNA mismatch repair protein MutS [Dehalococcoidia bacterium]
MATPVRKQYLDIKSQHPDAIVLFRIGDFYETFDDDAIVASRDLEIVLTKRDMGKGEVVPLAGIPYHSIDTYLSKLIKKGHHVAICEQIGEPTNRKLVDRKVVRVVTPGTVVEPSILDNGSNNFLSSLIYDSGRVGIASVDISTGEFIVTELEEGLINFELSRLDPAEILVCTNNPLTFEGYSVTNIQEEFSDYVFSKSVIFNHFKIDNFESIGCEHFTVGISAVAAIIKYLQQTNSLALNQLNTFHAYSTESFMSLDIQTIKNLEIFNSGKWGEGKASLISILDETLTPMGRRLIRKWIGEPLLDIGAINTRLDAVEWFYQKPFQRQQIQAKLKDVSDLERILHRIGSGVAIPREVSALRKSLEQFPEIVGVIFDIQPSFLEKVGEIPDCEPVASLIGRTINDEPYGEVGKGSIIREGFSDELDEFRKASNDARGYITGLERQERERTGIPNLRVGYNKIFGYYLEVSNSHLGKVPNDYIRRQTLTGGERYLTPELKEYENKVLNARESVEALEVDIFKNLCNEIMKFKEEISRSARIIAKLDGLCSFAEIASRYRYVRPTLNDTSIIEIDDGRHPMAEINVHVKNFVPNSIRLSNENEQIIILTGPNMSGKSTYLRQVSLMVLMAQIGSYVPASKANIGVVDRIFTRVGLQDDLGAGQSTFMVEMVETANILKKATSKSLIVLDEVGRGTSTFDGMSIAQSVIEYIHDSPNLGCKALFATHYHELTSLVDSLDRVCNFKVAVDENEQGVTFLHQIIPGGADKSYGIHVASLAGLPYSVVNRSWDLLNQHESDYQQTNNKGDHAKSFQLPLFEINPSISKKTLSVLMNTDPDNMTPLQALNFLHELKSKINGPDRESGNDSS